MNRSTGISLAVTLCAAVTTALLILPAPGARAVFVVIFAIITGAALCLSLIKITRPATPLLLDSLQAGEQPDRNDSAQSIALGKLFEATINGMREGVIIIDYDMRVLASNLAARRVFAYATGALNNRSLNELTRNMAIYTAFLDALKGTERTGIKVESRSAEKSVFDLRVFPLRLGTDKNQTGAIGVFFDITQIEKLERVRQEFLSNVSHELRTPLTSIIAFVETLEGGALDDADNNRRFLSIISKNAARMHTLIDDILELSAIESGSISIEPVQVSLRALVSNVTAALGAKASARDVILHNEVPAEARVFADVNRLEQMLTNLVENAIKFNREGGTVTIRHERESTLDEILVADTGDGIPQEHHERLFERFYRVDKARSQQMGGTGLGLAIVKHLARAHSGEVTLRSAVGEGSVFSIKLPSASGEGAQN